MIKQYRSPMMASIRETAEGLPAAGLRDKQTMRKFDDACLTPVRPLTPDEIHTLRKREGASQPVFARDLNDTTGLISQWERSEKHPQGASLKLQSLVARHGRVTFPLFQGVKNGRENDRNTTRRPTPLTVTRVDRHACSIFELFSIVTQTVEACGLIRSVSEQWADTSTTAGRLITVLGRPANVDSDMSRTQTARGRRYVKAWGKQMGHLAARLLLQQDEARQRGSQSATLNESAESYSVASATIARL